MKINYKENFNKITFIKIKIIKNGIIIDFNEYLCILLMNK